MKGGADVDILVDAPGVNDIYGLIGEVTLLLEQGGFAEKANEFVSRAVRLTTYDAVLDLSQDYVQYHNGGSHESATE